MTFNFVMYLIRLHRQVRELRDDVADAERKESDQNKKRKMAVSKIKYIYI